jgi:hypothetical protein
MILLFFIAAVKNFREYLTIPKVFKSIKITYVSEALLNDPVKLAQQKCLDIFDSIKLFKIAEDKSKIIDKVVEAATAGLNSLKGAME